MDREGSVTMYQETGNVERLCIFTLRRRAHILSRREHVGGESSSRIIIGDKNRKIDIYGKRRKSRTLFSAKALESGPKARVAMAVLKEARPSMGRYSWSMVVSLAICSSTLRTTGRTHGLPSSVR